MAGAASMMMSPPIDSSLSCKMPSRFTSTADSKDGSTLFQAVIQSGNWLNGVPTTSVKTSYFTNTASAGAVM